MTERDIIKQFLTSINVLPSRENIEKVTTLRDQLESYKRLKFSNLGTVEPARGLRKAVAIYNPPERIAWIKKREEVMKIEYRSNQAIFAGAISEWYSQIMQTLPRQEQAIIATLLRNYQEGVTSNEIANALSTSVNVIQSQLAKLRKVGFVATIRPGKVMYYYVPDRWWHLSFAVKSDGRFLKWWDEHRTDKDLHDVVDRFIREVVARH
jgi:predicted transcriptional regulator